jgi:hypothetical protein
MSAVFQISDADRLRFAEERALCDIEELGSWLNCNPDEREPSTYWGPISTVELCRIMLRAERTPTQGQRWEACEELRRRFLMHSKGYIDAELGLGETP